MSVKETPLLMTLEELKGHFEAESTYLVFESPVDPETSAEFRGAIAVCTRLGPRIIERKIYYDQSGGRFLFVVRVNPRDRERVTGLILEAGLPKDALFSVYGSRP
ncbi:MAG: hypothetical protein JW821_05035 [Deltaproteobacteria bacterium]|nr:hypothetical protein [Deltaproteobacteria bacterium]